MQRPAAHSPRPGPAPRAQRDVAPGREIASALAGAPPGGRLRGEHDAAAAPRVPTTAGRSPPRQRTSSTTAQAPLPTTTPTLPPARVSNIDPRPADAMGFNQRISRRGGVGAESFGDADAVLQGEEVLLQQMPARERDGHGDREGDDVQGQDGGPGAARD